MESSDSRFKSLIQPIKDLAANWDIDIADSLNDYLEELEHLKISLDNGETQLNFAEAALLIQGSAAVYSKKVEYLYQLVIQSIEFITRKKSSVITKSKSRKDDDASILEDDILLFGSDPSFLLLDHVIEEGTNIDLKIDPEQARNRMSHNDSFMNTSLSTSQLSVSLLQTALNDDNKGSLLKLTSSFIDENGALLLGQFRPPTSFMPTTAARSDNHADMPMDVQKDSAPMFPVQDQDYGDMGGDDYGGGDDYYGGAGDDNYGGHPSDMPPSAAAAPLQPTHKPAPARSAKPNLLAMKEYVLLDPHTVVPGSKPIRKGRTYRLPAALSQKTASTDPADTFKELFG
eukprot:gene43904-53680_t